MKNLYIRINIYLKNLCDTRQLYIFVSIINPKQLMS